MRFCVSCAFFVFVACLVLTWLRAQACCSASITIVDGNKMRCVSGANGAVYGTAPLTRAAGGGAIEFLFTKGTVGDEVRCRQICQ